MESRHLGFFLTILLFLLTPPPALGKRSNDLDIRVYEVDERNMVQKILETKPGTDVILDRVYRIRLECSAPFPVQWIYSGNGVPTLSSTIRKESDHKFMASAFITSLKESHSGRYECFSTESPHEASAYFFIYVPGPNIFTAGGDGGSDEKKKIQIPKNDTIVRIPCAVSSPEIPVVLEKSAGEVLVAIKSLGTTPAYTFDPRVGFSLDIRLVQTPEGAYVCTAFGRGSKKTIEFEITSNPRETSGFYPTNEPITDKTGLFRCSTHTDCPPNWSCYTDLHCRDPCLNSIRCGSGAICKYNDRRPYCECPSDFVGDPMKECFNTLQGSEGGFQNTPRPNRPTPRPPATKPHTTAGNQCKVNEHCPQTHICLNGNCLDACSLKICDRNSYCVTDRNRIAKCECNPGFISEKGYDCSPLKIQVETFNPEVQGDAPPRSDSAAAFGHKKPCAHNRDCPANTICRSDSTQTPICTELCGSRICGENAKCQNSVCTCKLNFVGDPFTACFEERKPKSPLPITPTRSTKKEFDDCLTDSDCADKQRCQALSSYRTCVDACLTTRCPFNTECQGVGHNPVCTCPRGSTGSTQLGCTKVVDASSEFKRERDSPRNLQITKLEVSTQSSTLTPNCSTPSLNCGPNSECRLVEGEPTCFCQSNFVGQPPNCKRECTFNIECPVDQTCVQNRCRNACRNKCGKNARCRVSTGASRTHHCSCREGFEGNPESSNGCSPIRDHK